MKLFKARFVNRVLKNVFNKLKIESMSETVYTEATDKERAVEAIRRRFPKAVGIIISLKGRNLL